LNIKCSYFPNYLLVMRNLLLLVITTICLLGCSTLTGIDNKKPSDWTLVTQPSDLCEQLSGEYRNYGSSTYSPKGGSPFLAYRFGMNVKYVQDLESIKTVKIKCIDNAVIELHAIRTNATVLTRKLLRENGDWDIEKGKIIFPTVNESTVDGFGGYQASSTFRLSIGSDGSLIGEDNRGSLGLALWLIPVGGTQTFWFRWPRIM